jgi:hypothetical protein
MNEHMTLRQICAELWDRANNTDPRVSWNASEIGGELADIASAVEAAADRIDEVLAKTGTEARHV